jgi:YVTN family beta-propeller protein
MRYFIGLFLALYVTPSILPVSIVEAQERAAASSPILDFGYYRARIEPMFLVKRPGNVPCVECHEQGQGALKLQPLTDGGWTEDASRLNFKLVSAFVVPGKPKASRLLQHPLGREDGGDQFHGGGKHWSAKDPEYLTLVAWVKGETLPSSKKVVRVIQTNSAGDNVHVIDPATNKVVGIIQDIRIAHGVAAAPDGSRLYITDEALRTLDVVDARSLSVVARLPLTGQPNNVAITKDGGKVYVGIREEPGGLNVIDTKTLKNVKIIPIGGGIHNVYVTPDGKFVVAGSLTHNLISIADVLTDTLVRTIKMTAGVRPMAFETKPDGSTNRVFVQLTDYHGVVAVDFATGKELARYDHPAIAGVKANWDGLQGAPAHGLGITPDGKQLWSTSKVYGYAYVYSLPEMKELARVYVGQHPEWITFSPDGRLVYVAAAGDNLTFAVDIKTFKEVSRIPVGQVPKRNLTAILQTSDGDSRE